MNKYAAPLIIDAKQQFIYPGLIDAHAHFMGYAKSLNQLDMRGVESKEALYSKLADFSTESSSDWITGRGWDQNIWEDNTYPNKTWLDETFPNKYFVLKRVDGHAALVSQNVLDLAGITTVSHMAGGKVEVIDGKCTGILIDNAVDLVTKLIPEPSNEELLNLVLKAQKNCFEKGLTTVSDAGLDLEDVARIKQWQHDNKLLLKLYIMLNPTPENFDHFLSMGVEKNDQLTISSFKFYSDGALGSRGAHLLESYTDDEDNVGLELTSIDTLRKYAKLIYDAGFQMNTHAIGDGANREMLHLYGEFLQGTNDRRWRIEHAQVVQEDDRPLFAKYTIIPSAQPTHATSDMKWAIDRLGNERIGRAYAYKSLKDQNGMIALGTDFPVESIDPLYTLLSAVSRTDKNGDPHGGYYMEEGLSFEDCLRGMTIWAAMANFEDEKKGSLVQGKKADFVLFNRNLADLTWEDFDKYQTELLCINGKVVYKRP
jgi:predicted amidohydrolase YtcJ